MSNYYHNYLAIVSILSLTLKFYININDFLYTNAINNKLSFL